MRERVLIVRIPPETRSRARAIAAVTGLSLQDLVIAAFDKYYARDYPLAVLPLALFQISQLAADTTIADRLAIKECVSPPPGEECAPDERRG